MKVAFHQKSQNTNYIVFIYSRSVHVFAYKHEVDDFRCISIIRLPFSILNAAITTATENYLNLAIVASGKVLVYQYEQLRCEEVPFPEPKLIYESDDDWVNVCTSCFWSIDDGNALLVGGGAALFHLKMSPD